MKTHLLLSLGAIALVLAGCETRSISDSGYQSNSRMGPHSSPAQYVGELNELDVLGIERNAKITEEQITKALESAGQVKLRKGSRVLLVQSGARFPDEPMV